MPWGNQRLCDGWAELFEFEAGPIYRVPPVDAYPLFAGDQLQNWAEATYLLGDVRQSKG